MPTHPFEMTTDAVSQMVRFKAPTGSFESNGEPGGQLVRCQTGELELYGPTGAWVIPADHMVYIPADRPFRLIWTVASSGLVAQFKRSEVAWHQDGCWVGPVTDAAAMLLDYGQKWASPEAASTHAGRCFFVTLGDMVPEWFHHERIHWMPDVQDKTVQKAIRFVRSEGPDVSLPKVAAHMAMSERTLRRHLQAELGQTWREFIREYRMNHAMDLLRKDKRSVTETAFEVGFSSSSAFSQAFQAYVGDTPSAYARRFAVA